MGGLIALVLVLGLLAGNPQTGKTLMGVTPLFGLDPALREGGWTEWWREFDLVGYARSSGGDHALVLLNRSGSPRVLANGLAFAGLPEGAYEDVLTGRVFTSSGDSISVDVGANASAVLVWRP